MSAEELIEFVHLIVDGKNRQVAQRLRSQPELAVTVCPRGATRQEAVPFFFTKIAHYLYTGDTALHMAAAAFQRAIAERLINHGANCRARNRRGAEPLHYAADAHHWNPQAQADVIKYLVSAGADVHSVDKSGVAPLHRAIRTRSFAAVCALLDAGANPDQRNGTGSTPLHLAVQSTGASGSGTERARGQQAMIITILLERGARPTNRDARGKSVLQAARGTRIESLLDGENAA